MPFVSGCMAAAVIAVVDMGPAGAVWWRFSAWVALSTAPVGLASDGSTTCKQQQLSPCWQLCSNSIDPSVQSWAWRFV
jgi:hypothetical protein